MAGTIAQLLPSDLELLFRDPRAVMAARQSPAVTPSLSEAPDTTPPGPGAGDDTSTADRPKKAQRTFLTQNACTRCRQKKSKVRQPSKHMLTVGLSLQSQCDGKRPICARCEKHGAECIYDVAQEGVTRMQHLQNQLTSKSDDYDKLKQLFEAMQGGDNQRATMLLAKLRMGDSIDDLLSYVGESQGSSSSGCDGS